MAIDFLVNLASIEMGSSRFRIVIVLSAITSAEMLPWPTQFALMLWLIRALDADTN